jgi:hypothetical protein
MGAAYSGSGGNTGHGARRRPTPNCSATTVSSALSEFVGACAASTREQVAESLVQQLSRRSVHTHTPQSLMSTGSGAGASGNASYGGLGGGVFEPVMTQQGLQQVIIHYYCSR